METLARVPPYALIPHRNALVLLDPQFPQMTRIAVLGWGSLRWDPRKLCISGEWFDDGPSLPIEFARVSEDKRLTLVLYPHAEKIQVPWAHSGIDNRDEAIENLRDRENTPTVENIGFIDIPGGESRCNTVPAIVGDITQWARRKGSDIVIWTDLSENFRRKTRTDLSEENVLGYLGGLEGEARMEAENYVRNAPKQVRTRIRRTIEEALGWTPSEDAG